MRNFRQEQGQCGEDAAVRFLQAHGYRVVERNWRLAGFRGELDIVAWHGAVLCFIEVKTRTSNVQGAPGEAVTRAKQAQICKLATAFVAGKKIGESVACRFDVVEILLENDSPPRARLCSGAFDFHR